MRGYPKKGCEGLLTHREKASKIVAPLSNKAAVFGRTSTVNPLTPVRDDYQLLSLKKKKKGEWWKGYEH